MSIFLVMALFLSMMPQGQTKPNIGREKL
jgi:hypothetical protein